MPAHHTAIEGYELTLFYDYDKATLPLLSSSGKTEWFKQRMESLFVIPMKKLFDTKSSVYAELNHDLGNDLYPDFYTFMLAQMSILFNTIEFLGSTVRLQTKTKSNNGYNFRIYIRKYLPQWTKTCRTKLTKQTDLPSILWSCFRCGLAHGFLITHHSIDLHEQTTALLVDPRGVVTIQPVLFFNDFLASFSAFVSDIKGKLHSTFMKRFHALFP